ncbi:hypothetical protein ACWED2_09215 [Amycolatopsis sp. NPDC005003]
MATVEIRVHGIGDHAPSSALGSLPPVNDNPGSSVEEFKTHKLPDHAVRLVNWSRTSRRKAGFLWYLALPFTLLNVAGEMGPVGTARRRVFGAVVILSGFVLTIAVTTWALAILETVVKRLPWQVTASVTRWTLMVAAVVVVILMCARIRSLGRRDSDYNKLIGHSHVAVVLSYSVALVFWRPAARVVAPDILPDACEPVRDVCGVPADWDFVTTVVIGSSVLMLLFAGVAWCLSAAGHPKSVRRLKVSPGSGASLVIAMSLLWIHVTGSLLRLGVDWVLAYFHRYPAVQSLAGRPMARCDLPAPIGQSTLPPCERVLLVFDESRVPVFLPDIVATYGFAAVVALALALALVLLVHRMRGAKLSTRWLVLHLPKVLPWTLAAAFALFIGEALALHYWVFHPDRALGWWYSAAITVTHLLAAATLAFLLLGRRSPTVRKVFGMIADILGFWPVTTHPLAGQSYREDIVTGIRQVVARHTSQAAAGERENVVLAGHSQGSVLCAWLAAKSKAPLPIHLVTCGSPLASLYGSYFPLHFSEDLFVKVRSNVVDWTNYWRDSDPIATALPTPSEDSDDTAPNLSGERNASPEIVNIRLDNGIVGHSDYWVDPGFTFEEASVDRRFPPASRGCVV